MRITDLPISIHALREEGDFILPRPNRAASHFYPRPPRGGRHPLCKPEHTETWISIHALREEGDQRSRSPPAGDAYFYPRPPRGGRQVSNRSSAAFFYFYPRPPRGGRHTTNVFVKFIMSFLSTPSARRATRPCVAWEQGHSISIHALREEGDANDRFFGTCNFLFLSTPSARRATIDAPT